MSQLQVLAETNQALDFIITSLLNPGDCVIIEEPVSPDVYRVIQLAGCRFITVPVDKDGMVCDNLEPLIEEHAPKFIYVNSSYQDPTGCILSLERRQRLLELSARHHIPIVEEDAGSSLNYEDGTISSLKAMHNKDFAPEGSQLWYDYDDPFSIEGGDVLVLNSETVAIGLSQRTTATGIERFAENILHKSTFKRVLVLDIPKSRAFMALAYTPGAILYFANQKQKGEKMFPKSYDLVVFVIMRFPCRASSLPCR